MNVPHAFILGCERSGSTWLSNVLDAHAGVEFFMEPFADYAALFPGFASRNLYVEGNSKRLEDIVKKGYDDLGEKKYKYFYKRGGNLHWKKIDKLIANFSLRTLGWQNAGIQVKQYQLLNLNSVDIPVRRQTKKIRTPELAVTKELRLNFKVSLLQKVFPSARYIIVVRHPGAQVESIMKLFRKGNLGELRNALLFLYDSLRISRRFNKYSAGYKILNTAHEMREMLLLWWLINYETVIEDCKRYNLDYKIVYHDDLSEAPVDSYEKIFSFLGVNMTQDVSDYINYSTGGGVRKRSADLCSPVNTVRDSSRHSKNSISNIDINIQKSVSDLYRRTDVIEELSRYRIDM